MSYYGRIQLVAELGRVSDYSDARIHKGKLVATPDEATVFDVDAPSTGITLDLGMFTTITNVVIFNNSVFTGTLTVTFTAASTVSKVVVAATAGVTGPPFCVLGAIDPAADLVLAESNNGNCTVIVFGT